MVKKMKLSENFHLSELTKSVTATRHGFKEQFNVATFIIANLSMLCSEVLQPLRDFLDSPVRITSGYRCKRLNTQVGGSPTSDHVKGLAADIEGWDESDMLNIKLTKCAHGAYIELCDRPDADTHLVYINSAILLYIAFNLEDRFSQLISEYGTEEKCEWVHVSVPDIGKKGKGEILRKEHGKGYRSMSKEQLFDSITGR